MPPFCFCKIKTCFSVSFESDNYPLRDWADDIEPARVLFFKIPHVVLYPTRRQTLMAQELALAKSETQKGGNRSDDSTNPQNATSLNKAAVKSEGKS